MPFHQNQPFPFGNGGAGGVPGQFVGGARDQAALVNAQNAQARIATANRPNDFRSNLFNQQLGFATGGMNNLGQSIMNQFARVNAANQQASLTIRAINAGSPVEQERIRQQGLGDRTSTIFGQGGVFDGIFGGGGAGSGAGGFQSVGPDGNVINSVGGQSQVGITPFPGLGDIDANGQAAIGGLGQSQLPGPSGFGGGPNEATQRQFADINRAQSDRLSNTFTRQIAEEGAGQRNASQLAIANAGVQGGNLFARMRNLPIQKRAFGQNLASRFAGQVA